MTAENPVAIHAEDSSDLAAITEISAAEEPSVPETDQSAVPAVSSTPDTSDHTDLILDFAVMAGAIVWFS